MKAGNVSIASKYDFSYDKDIRQTLLTSLMNGTEMGSDVKCVIS